MRRVRLKVRGLLKAVSVSAKGWRESQDELLCRVFPEHVLLRVASFLGASSVLTLRAVCRWFSLLVDANWRRVVAPLYDTDPRTSILRRSLDEGCVAGLERLVGRLGFESNVRDSLPACVERAFLHGRTPAVLFLCDHFGLSGEQLQLRKLVLTLAHLVSYNPFHHCTLESSTQFPEWNMSALDTLRALMQRYGSGLEEGEGELGMDEGMSDDTLLAACVRLYMSVHATRT